MIELMIVLSIIGILSTISIGRLRILRYKALASEAKKNLGSIRVCEVAYKAELETYYGPIGRYPATAGPHRQSWTNSQTAFSVIGFDPDAYVYFNYAVTLADNSTFTADAYSDLDGDGVDAHFTITPLNSIQTITGRFTY